MKKESEKTPQKKVDTNKGVKETFQELIINPGQGDFRDQVGKLVRREQRIMLHKMLQQLGKKDLDSLPVMLDASSLQIDKKTPAVIRMYLPTWKNHDEVFWQALGDYAILALHRVTDVKYSSCRGKITVYYFNKRTAAYENSPEDVRKIIQGIAFLVDNDVLRTDYTRFRSMAERDDSLGAMSKEKAAFFGLVLKLI